MTTKKKAEAPLVERGMGEIRPSGPRHHTIWITRAEFADLREKQATKLVVATDVMRDDTIELVGQSEGGEPMVPLAAVAVVGTVPHAHGAAVLVEIMK
jgi:hypothetical protein